MEERDIAAFQKLSYKAECSKTNISREVCFDAGKLPTTNRIFYSVSGSFGQRNVFSKA